MDRRKYIVDAIAKILPGSERVQTAEMIVERLEEEGVLHLGYGDAEIDSVVEAFKEAFGTTKTTKYDRFAANRLVKKYGAKSVVGIIQLLKQGEAQKYRPVVNSVAELETKLPSILNFLRSQRGDETIEV